MPAGSLRRSGHFHSKSGYHPVEEDHSMCSNIKQLRRPDFPVTDEELREAALQHVRKISGYRKPSRANSPAFEAAVDEVATATKRLLIQLQSTA
jgi:hypothetical protein